MASLLKRSESKEPPPPVARKRRSRIGEMTTDISTMIGSGFGSLRRNFWPRSSIAVPRKVTYAVTRKLYKNDDRTANLAGFGKRIVNSTVDFLGLPYSATGDEVVDEFLNSCIHTYWRNTLPQAVRDSVRDGETVVRVRRHSMDNKLVSPEEWEACYLEIVPPETCVIYYKQGADQIEIEKSYIRHEVDVVVEPASSMGRALREPVVKTHVIFEELTPERFRYYNETTGAWMDDLEQSNSWGFVPLVECINELDAAAKSGNSDLEAPLPFIMAFHDVMGQALIAHKAHSIPKAMFKVNDLMNFIANNWPDSFTPGPDGRPDITTFSGEISWKGTEILFFEPTEDGGFMEVQSALGDSKTLLDFILTCISISSETPRSLLMNQTTVEVDEMLQFSKKIERKRNFFSDPITVICKMVLAINHMVPTKVPLSWEEISPTLALQKAQMLQQEIMSMEVLATRQVVSDRTVRQHIKPFVSEMKSNDREASDAKSNVKLDQQAPNAPTSSGSVTGTDSGRNA